MPTKCCVYKCESNTKCPGIRLYRFPWSSGNLEVLTKRRIERWKEALGYGPNFNPTHKRICNLHFKKGKPARITDEYDSDWVPTLKLPKKIEVPSKSVLKHASNATTSLPPAHASSSSSLSTVSSVHNDSSPFRSCSGNKRTITTTSPHSEHHSRKRYRMQAHRSSNDSGTTHSKPYPSHSCSSSSIRSAFPTSSNQSKNFSEVEEQSSSCSSYAKSQVSSSSSERSSRKHQRMRPSSREIHPSESSTSTNRSSCSERSSRKRHPIQCSLRETSESGSSISVPSKGEEHSSASSERSYSKSQAASSHSGLSAVNLGSPLPSNSRVRSSDSSVAPFEETVSSQQSQHPLTNFQEETEMKLLKEKLLQYEHQMKLNERGFEFISVSDKKCLYFTGITSFSTVKTIFEHLEPNISRPRCNFTKQQIFTMTLTKLRLNPQFKTLSYDYNVCSNTVAKYFYRTLNVIDSCLRYSLDVPSLDVLLRHTPENFRKEFGERRVFIIDCFEVRSETPQNLTAAAIHFSNYKKSETTKFLIAICPDGNICFISSGFGGRCSDKKIVADCGFLNILEPGDVVLADKGFDISNLIETRGAVLNIPSFLKNKKQFEPVEIAHNRQVTKYRIHVERCIGILKSKFQIISHTITVDTLVRFENSKNAIDLIARVCCILYNFNRSIIPNY